MGAKQDLDWVWMSLKAKLRVFLYRQWRAKDNFQGKEW